MHLHAASTDNLRERRQRAVARLMSTGNVDAVARAFDVTRVELLEWVAEATGQSCDKWDDFDGLPQSAVAHRPVAPAKRVDSPHTEASVIALILGALPLPAWPMMALWAVIGGFIDGRGSTDTAIFGWALVSYPFVYVPCVIAWVVAKRRRPALALCFAAAPCVQSLVCMGAFVHGVWRQTAQY